MAKRKRAGAITRTSTAPPTASAPALAPARPVDGDVAETAAVRNSDPHRVGADRAARLRADVAAARARHAIKNATGKLPAAPEPAAKPVAKAATKKKKPAAAKPAAAIETY